MSSVHQTVSVSSPLHMPVTVTTSNFSYLIGAFIDSGSASSFISQGLSKRLHFWPITLNTLLAIQSVVTQPLGRGQITHQSPPLELHVKVCHKETIVFYVLQSSTSPIILGRPWLIQHSPQLSWKTVEILPWRQDCYSDCITFPVSQLLQKFSLTIHLNMC